LCDWNGTQETQKKGIREKAAVFCSDFECWDLPQSSLAQPPELTLSLPPWGHSLFLRGVIPYCSAPPAGHLEEGLSEWELGN